MVRLNCAACLPRAPQLPSRLPPITAKCRAGLALQVDEVLRSARSVREVLDGTLHVLRPETLDAPPPRTPVRRVPLPAFDPELPPSPAR